MESIDQDYVTQFQQYIQSQCRISNVNDCFEYNYKFCDGVHYCFIKLFQPINGVFKDLPLSASRMSKKQAKQKAAKVALEILQENESKCPMGCSSCTENDIIEHIHTLYELLLLKK